MSNFSTPFAQDNTEKRVANSGEKNDGFPCGPLSQALFNGLFHQLQSELNEIHKAAGIRDDDTVFNSTVRAINQLIATAVAAIDIPDFPSLANYVQNTSQRILGAWVSCGINGVIRSSYNVTSVTRFETGHFQINFSQPMQINGYAVSAIAEEFNDSGGGTRHPIIGRAIEVGPITSYRIFLIDRNVTVVNGGGLYLDGPFSIMFTNVL